MQTSDQEAVKTDPVLSKAFRKNQLRGGLFEKGMFDDIVGEGWDNPQDIRPEYQPSRADGNTKRQIDGVLTVTSSVQSDILEQIKSVTQHFLDDKVVSFPLVREGNVRPEAVKGKEQ